MNIQILDQSSVVEFRESESQKSAIIASVGCTHVGHLEYELSNEQLNSIEQSDCLILAGDITERGSIEEIELAFQKFKDIKVPKFYVMGNHDHFSKNELFLHDMFTRHDRFTHLEKNHAQVDTEMGVVTIFGAEGFTGGFSTDIAKEYSQEYAEYISELNLEQELLFENPMRDVCKDTALFKVAVTHYAPFAENLVGEDPDIEIMLGSRKLGQILQKSDFDLYLHAHTHKASKDLFKLEDGMSLKNVAYPATHQQITFLGITTKKN